MNSSTVKTVEGERVAMHDQSCQHGDELMVTGYVDTGVLSLTAYGDGDSRTVRLTVAQAAELAAELGAMADQLVKAAQQRGRVLQIEPSPYQSEKWAALGCADRTLEGGDDYAMVARTYGEQGEWYGYSCRTLQDARHAALSAASTSTVHVFGRDEIERSSCGVDPHKVAIQLLDRAGDQEAYAVAINRGTGAVRAFAGSEADADAFIAELPGHRRVWYVNAYNRDEAVAIRDGLL